MHRILIVDDNEAIHADFRKILGGRSPSTSLADAKAALFGTPAAADEALRFDVVTAAQGREGLEKLEAAAREGRPFSMAFVDMRMPPGWDGIETIQRLWAVDADLQVVICTAYSDHSWDEISRTLGLTDRLLILKKPFDPVEVLQLAAALTEKQALRRQAALKLDELERLVEQRTAELMHEARHDRLTGLANRSLLKERLAQALDRAARGECGRVGVFFLDFDRFKVINDSLGHDAGDQMLAEIARRLTACLLHPECASRCAEAMAARMGGDEFVVLAMGMPHEHDGAEIAAHLLRELAEPFELMGYTLTTSASIGVTTSDRGYADADGALRDADIAMYQAKAAGKARYVIFDSAMHESMRARLAMENDFRGAAERGELELHYQPVVAVSSGDLRGFEALVRWRHPRRGLVPPGAFIPWVEETGAIVSLGRWVLREACRPAAAWRARFPAAGGLVVSVNVSAKQLVLPRFVEEVEQTLAEFGVPPACIALEITESAVISDPEAATEPLARLRSLGLGIYMDDFGTGYSSLSYLHHLPLSGLKVDRSFMRNLSERRDYAAVVHAIVNLARNLGVAVIAEGVEDEDQVAMLQAVECEYAQGFFFGRPLEPAGAEELLERRLERRPAA